MSELTVGREPVQIVEIDQDYCNNNYGINPCTASIGVTGTDRCFNTRKTCQDPNNYGRGNITLRFVKPVSNITDEQYLIPSLVSVDTTPTVINVGGNAKDKKALGTRATATIVFQDHPHTDRVVDKYRTQRSYDPLERSTFWAKWIARNPYYQNRTVRILDGYVGQSISQMQSRTYVIESISGPDNSGRTVIKAKDILALSDDKKSQIPKLSTGELIADITDTDTVLRVTGAIVDEYPVPGVVRIGDELIEYTGVVTIDETEINLTGCTRGTNNGGQPSQHSSTDRVQYCVKYDNVNCVDIVNDVLVNYTNIDTEFIPLADWITEKTSWLNQFNVSTILSEPVGVNQILSELMQQCTFYMWWDERAQEIKLKAIRPVVETPSVVNDDSHIVADSVNMTDEPKERISQVWVFYDQKDPTDKLDNDKNYNRVRITADLSKEAPEQYGEQVIKKVYSRWIKTNAQAIGLGARLLARFKDNPKYMSISLDAKDRNIWTGDIIDVTHRNIVNEYGEPLQTRFQAISAEESDSGHTIRFKLQKFEFLGRFSFIMNNNAPDYLDATEQEKQTGCWLSGVDGTMSDNSDGYYIQ